MTVCIAAVCQWQGKPMIVGASDRMLTAGDIEFEPLQAKFYLFTPHIVALVAGSATDQLEICESTLAHIRLHPTTDVGGVADTYGRAFAAFRRKAAERAILAPLGLDVDTFLRRQREMSPDLVRHLESDLHRHRLEIETIVMGVDTAGAHIYVVHDPGQPARFNSIGFAAVGIGAAHAQSQFMFAGYTRFWPFERALFLTYTAKKRAEVAPGVGNATDVFIVGPHANPMVQVPQQMVDELQKIHDAAKAKERAAGEEAHQTIEKFIRDALAQEAAKQMQQTKPPAGGSPGS